MNGKQLKNSILQWAIQGKLVPQDPNDEPASVLLERIRAEKARLVKEKKIKKDKNESIIYRGDDNSYYEKFLATGEVKCIDDEIPFEIPKGWEWTRIRNISQSYIGLTYSPTDVSSRGTIVLRSSNIQDGKIVLNDVVRVSKEISKKLQVEKNDIIICARNGSAKLVGKSAVVTDVTEPMTFGAFMAICKTALYQYVSIFLQSDLFFSQLRGVSGTTTINQLTQNNFNDFWIPIPPANEQKRIVEKLQNVSPFIERYSKSQETLNLMNIQIKEQLKKSILQEAIQGKLVPQIAEEGTAQELLEQIRQEKQKLVKEGKLKKSVLTDSVIYKGDDNKYYEQIDKENKEITEDILFDLPNKWQWCRIGTIFMHNNGKQLNKGNSKGKLMKYITTSNLYWDGFVLDNLKEMPFENNEIDRCMAVKGDLLVCEGGDIGRSCIWNYDFPIMLQNHIHKLRPYIPLCTKFFYYIFNLYNLAGLIGGKGIGIQGFSSKALHNTLVPLPPLKEQYRIVTQIEKLFEQLR
ncbi:restriction endonuclease subunit S [Phocaeicola vulgatus]|uniref:Restriction endonuclease subunit S n=2 Tax=Bacteroidaceae TaxID=815 RepID=A0A6G0FYE2_PHOVU|nr:restriction endonuclease subunit S [Phocaeicola vulgatus]MZU80659.1 restriction endonuclease subunit S [Escherichia coli]KAB3571346.1 restriction endonuclease subunit S [Phocaeicola vulgatus]KAB3585867.1 restriction endonuclease subunit S [Phocaeicola vulgatus]KAB3596925.1 restriction endonuclease subunit S [Phocaeicola vulgatus]